MPTMMIRAFHNKIFFVQGAFSSLISRRISFFYYKYNSKFLKSNSIQVKLMQEAINKKINSEKE